MLPSNARPLFASIASGVSITAAIAIAGIAALAAFETAAGVTAPSRGQTDGVLTLADVPRPDLHPIALGPHATGALPALAGELASAGDTRARATGARIAEQSPAARQRRNPRRTGRTQARRSPTSAPVAQTPAPASANAPAAANAAPADSATGATDGRPRKRAVRTSGSTPGRSRPAGPARGRQDASARGRETYQSANGQAEPSTHASHPGRGTTRRQRPDRARGKTVGHRKAVVVPQSSEPPAPSSAPPASPPGHANGHGQHGDPPGANRRRDR